MKTHQNQSMGDIPDFNRTLLYTYTVSFLYDRLKNYFFLLILKCHIYRTSILQNVKINKLESMNVLCPEKSARLHKGLSDIS